MNNIKMKAVTRKKYGPPEVLQLSEVEMPKPKDNELLINIKATAVTNSDIFIRGSKLSFPIIVPFRLMMGLFKPRKEIIGLVFSGIVKDIGSKIKRFTPGDEVYGMTGFNLGAYAEYTCVKEIDSTTGCVSIKAKNISFEEATSAVYGGALALQYMDLGNIQQNQHVLVYGASGTSGTIAVQYAKYLGANVTGVCSGKNIDFVKSLGADDVIDYTTTDTLKAGTKIDFLLDCAGHGPDGKKRISRLKEECEKSLVKNGKIVSIDDGALKLDSKRLDFLTKLIEEGKIRPIIDKTYPLKKIVEAHKYVEDGHKKGGVAIKVC